MNKEVIFSMIYCIITVGAFLFGKYIFPKVPAEVWDKLDELSKWAANFVVWAREFKKNLTGQEKMAEVVKQLKTIADEKGIEVTEEQLRAIAQTAYEAMKAGEAEAQPAKFLEAVATPAATVVINTAGPVTAQTAAGEQEAPAEAQEAAAEATQDSGV